jgi:hypothetical protein
MTKRCLTITRRIIPIALTAVVSLTVAHGLDLGEQTLGGGPSSTVAIIGDGAGLICCAISAWFGMRQLRRTWVC